MVMVKNVTINKDVNIKTEFDSFYELNKEYKFQSYLNRINDYFYYLIYLIDKEM